MGMPVNGPSEARRATKSPGEGQDSGPLSRGSAETFRPESDTIARLTFERDRARATAAALEQELAALNSRIRSALMHGHRDGVNPTWQPEIDVWRYRDNPGQPA